MCIIHLCNLVFFAIREKKAQNILRATRNIAQKFFYASCAKVSKNKTNFAQKNGHSAKTLPPPIYTPDEKG